jgi:2-methylcitrate dehydratase PrpD
MQTGLTRALAQRALATRYETLSDEIRMLARQCVLDTLGVAVAGADDPLVRILHAELAEQGGNGVATIWGSTEKLPALSAALLNGTIAHALDYDDVNMAMPGHPSVAILPAVLALAEERGAIFAQLLTAFVAGYETACRLGVTMAPGHYDGIGFHATGTIGAFGAAAACAHLLGLTEDQTVHALGITATQAAGLKSQFGTMCKPLHAGRAAQNGLLAARLAARGFTSRPDAIECRQGFASTHSPDFNPERANDTPAGGSYIRANLFKYHAACYLTHAGIEAARKLRLDHHISPDQIAAITLRVDDVTDRVCNIPKPRDGLEIKFSHRMTAAMALSGTDTGRLDAYSETTASNPALIALRDLINIELTPGLGHTRASMEVRLRDQTSVSAAQDSGIPAPDVSAQGTRLRAKFAGLVSPVMGEFHAARLAASVDALEDQPAAWLFA